MKKYLLILLIFICVKVNAQIDSNTILPHMIVLNGADTIQHKNDSTTINDTTKPYKGFRVSISIIGDSFNLQCHDCKLKIIHNKNQFEEVVMPDRKKSHLPNHIDTTIKKHQ